MAEALDVTIKVDGIQTINRLLQELPDKALGLAKRRLDRTLLDGVRYCRSRFLSGSAGGLRARSGHLRRSIGFKSRIRSNQVEGEFGSFDRTYNLIQEEGGTIRPKKAKWLTIPVKGGPAESKTGRFTKKARDFKNTFVMGSKHLKGGRGTAAIMQKIPGKVTKRGKKVDKFIPIFWLVKQVKIKGIHYVKRTAEERILPKYTEQLESVIIDYWNKQ